MNKIFHESNSTSSRISRDHPNLQNSHKNSLGMHNDWWSYQIKQDQVKN